jgi:hypothetical protein
VAKKPKPAGGKPSPAKDLNGAREIVRLLTGRLREGHAEAAGSIARWLDAYPELKGECRALDTLAAKAEAAWVSAVGGGDPLAERAARDEAAAMTAELLGDAPSLLDRVLASAVVVAALSYYRAAQVAAQPAAHPGVRESRERVLSAAQKRLVAAVKGWELVAKKKAEGLRPRKMLKVFEPAAAG